MAALPHIVRNFFHLFSFLLIFNYMGPFADNESETVSVVPFFLYAELSRW